MALIHPLDLEAFRRDEASRRSFRTLRRLRHALRRSDGPTPLWLWVPDTGTRVLLAVDTWTLSSRVAVLGVLDRLDAVGAGVLAPFPPGDLLADLPTSGGRTAEVSGIGDLSAALPSVRVVVSAGAHVPAGALAHAWITGCGGNSVVVQHGMVLPQAAPLPEGAVLAAWSEADAEFWRSGRSDVTTVVVGSELLRRARETPVESVSPRATPVYCGALHGTELPRAEIERVARQFCLATGARYRPHPRETDLQSRLTHLVWRRLGIGFAASGGPLVDVGAPVVGMWSTGILEAASAGLPAWVYHPDPPPWLVEVWERYGLSVWGSDPTPVSPLGSGDPASRLAETVLGLVD